MRSAYMLFSQQLFHELALDLSFKIADEVRSTESAIISSYPTGVSRIIILLNTKHCLDKNISNFIFYQLEVSIILRENFPW